MPFSIAMLNYQRVTIVHIHSEALRGPSSLPNLKVYKVSWRSFWLTCQRCPSVKLRCFFDGLVPVDVLKHGFLGNQTRKNWWFFLVISPRTMVIFHWIEPRKNGFVYWDLSIMYDIFFEVLTCFNQHKSGDLIDKCCLMMCFGNHINGNSRILAWRYCTYFWPYFVVIFTYIDLKNRPYIW